MTPSSLGLTVAPPLHRATISFTSGPDFVEARVTARGRLRCFRVRPPRTNAYTAAAQAFVNEMVFLSPGTLEPAWSVFSEAFGAFSPVFEAALAGAERAVLTLDAQIVADAVDDLLAVPWEALVVGSRLLGERALIVRAGEQRGAGDQRGSHSTPVSGLPQENFRIVTVNNGDLHELDVPTALGRPALAYSAEAFGWDALPATTRENLYVHLSGDRKEEDDSLLSGAPQLTPEAITRGLGRHCHTLLVANTCSSFYELGGTLTRPISIRNGGSCAWPAPVPGLTLVATMWSVTTPVAKAWGTSFFTELLAGASVAEAILASRQAHPAADPRRSWLAYSVHGDVDLVPFPRQRT